MLKRTKSEKVFSVFNTLILALLAFACIYPLVYVLAASLSSPQFIASGDVWFWPKGFTIDAFKKVVERRGIWTSYGNSFFYMIVGTAVQMVVTVLGAYPLSRERLVGRRVINVLVAFTMWFNAGIIPMYLNFKSFGLLDTRTAIILMGLTSTYYIIASRSFFQFVNSVTISCFAGDETETVSAWDAERDF